MDGRRQTRSQTGAGIKRKQPAAEGKIEWGDLPDDLLVESGDDSGTEGQNPHFPAVNAVGEEQKVDRADEAADVAPIAGQRFVVLTSCDHFKFFCEFFSCNIFTFSCVFISAEDVVTRHVQRVRDPTKTLGDAMFQCFHKLGQKVHALLKDYNDPAKAEVSADLFVPVALCDACISPMLRELASNVFQLNSFTVHAITTRANLELLMHEDFQTATWGTDTTKVLCSAGYPFNFRCSRGSEGLVCAFVAEARKSNGELIIRPDQKLK